MFKALFDSAKSAVEAVSEAVESEIPVTNPTPRTTHDDSVEEEVAKIDSRGGKVQLPSVRVESSSPEDYDIITKESVEDEIPLLHTPGYTSGFSAYSAEDTPKEESFVHVRDVADTLKSVGNSLLDKGRAGAIAVGEGFAQAAKETNELARNMEKIDPTITEVVPIKEDLDTMKGASKVQEDNETLSPDSGFIPEIPIEKVMEPVDQACKTETMSAEEETIEALLASDEAGPDTRSPQPTPPEPEKVFEPRTEEGLNLSKTVFDDLEKMDKIDVEPVVAEETKAPEEASKDGEPISEVHKEEGLKKEEPHLENPQLPDKTVSEPPEAYATEKVFVEEKPTESQGKLDTTKFDIEYPKEEVLKQEPFLVEDEPICEVQEQKYEASIPEKQEQNNEETRKPGVGEKVLDAGSKIVGAVLDKAQTVNEKVEDILLNEHKEESGVQEPQKEPSPKAEESVSQEDVPEVAQPKIGFKIGSKDESFEVPGPLAKEPTCPQLETESETKIDIPTLSENVTEVMEVSSEGVSKIAEEATPPPTPPPTEEVAGQTVETAMIEIDPEGSWPTNCSNLVMDVIFEGAGDNRASAATVCNEKEESTSG